MMFSAIFLVVFYAGVATCQNCRAGWQYHEGSCYGSGTDLVSWAEAEEMCEVFQSNLAEVNTQSENAFLKQMAANMTANKPKSNSPISVWLGGTDIMSEGHWVWVGSKEPVGDLVDWAPGEPNEGRGTGQDCMTLYKYKNWQWDDDDCRNGYFFICETESFEVIG